MAENRVTAQTVETAIKRSSVPGDARVTAESLEVALLKDVVPGALVRVTSQALEIAIVRTTGTDSARAGDFFFAVP